jgi:peptide/nickel transport system substrate-binding protein
MKRTIFLVVLAALLTLPLVVGAQDDTLLRALPPGGDITTLNPILATDGSSIDVIGFLYDGLFKVNTETAAPEPGLATWTVSDDGLIYTFTLVDGVMWSDGTPITANDVVFTYNAIVDDSVPSPRKAAMELIESITAVDDRTVEIVLSSVNCTVWGNTFGALTPIPAHVFNNDVTAVAEHPFNSAPTATSGEYMFAEWNPGEFVRVTANPDYREGAPGIANVIFRVVADPAVQNQALQTGEVDYAFMYPDQLAQIPDQTPFNVNVAPNNNTPLMILNWADPANPQPAYDEDGNLVEQTPNRFFADVRVRQAIAMGYDKVAIAATLGEGYSEPLVGPFTPGFGWANDPEVTAYPYNPEMAAQLLDEAGWVDSDGDGIRDKDGVPFSFTLIYSPLVDLWQNIALVAQDQLGQLGIEVTVESMEWSAYLSDVLLTQEFDATIVGFGGGVEVDGIAYNIMYSRNDVPGSGFNLTSYVNPEMDRLLDEARSLPGCAQEERAALYNQVQQIAMEDVAYDFTVLTTAIRVMNTRVTGYQPGTWNETWNVLDWGIGG